MNVLRAGLEFAGLLAGIWLLVGLADPGSAVVAILGVIPFLVAGLLAVREFSLSKAVRRLNVAVSLFFAVVMLGSWSYTAAHFSRRGLDLPFFILPATLAWAFTAGCISARLGWQVNRRTDEPQ